MASGSVSAFSRNLSLFQHSKGLIYAATVHKQQVQFKAFEVVVDSYDIYLISGEFSGMGSTTGRNDSRCHSHKRSVWSGYETADSSTGEIRDDS